MLIVVVVIAIAVALYYCLALPRLRRLARWDGAVARSSAPTARAASW
jgi:hypothetical protein